MHLITEAGHLKMHTLSVLLVRVVMAVFRVSAHSWITCTDYLEQNGEYWSSNLCRAFPRHAAQFTNKNEQFGLDKGYNIINPPNSAPCRTRGDDSGAYTADHPMAVYYLGQKVVITHPTKVSRHPKSLEAFYLEVHNILTNSCTT